MEWSDLEKPWQVCFELGWESLKKGSIPIGAVITNEKGEIISEGRSMQFENIAEPGAIVHHRISHAELNAILKVSEFDHPEIRKYTIYTTTEPCPMCFGAIVNVLKSAKTAPVCYPMKNQYMPNSLESCGGIYGTDYFVVYPECIFAHTA